MRKISQKAQYFFSQRSCWLFFVFFLLTFAFFSMAPALPEVSAGKCAVDECATEEICAINNFVPEPDTEDEKSLRWDYHWHLRTLQRVDSRTLLRTGSYFVPRQEHKDGFDLICCDVLQKCKLRHDEIKYNYYRNLWRSTLPRRAGPPSFSQQSYFQC